ncbi:MAG: hypothetical protein U0Z44_10680 [Kouleothrix sp.]
MNRPVCPFQIAFGPRTIGAAYLARRRRPLRGGRRSAAAAGARGAGGTPARAGAAVPLGDAAEAGARTGPGAIYTGAARCAAARGAHGCCCAQPPPASAPDRPARAGRGRHGNAWSMGASSAWRPALRPTCAGAREPGVPHPQPLVLHGPLRVLAIAAPGEELQLAGCAQHGAGRRCSCRAIELRLVGDVASATLERALLAGPVHVALRRVWALRSPACRGCCCAAGWICPTWLRCWLTPIACVW